MDARGLEAGIVAAVKNRNPKYRVDMTQSMSQCCGNQGKMTASAKVILTGDGEPTLHFGLRPTADGSRGEILQLFIEQFIPEIPEG